MLNCKEVSKLVSESLDHKLSWWQRLNLWIHLSMCKICWGFRKDVTHLQRETRHCANESVDADMDSEVKLPDETRERIKQRLESQQ